MYQVKAGLPCRLALASLMLCLMFSTNCNKKDEESRDDETTIISGPVPGETMQVRRFAVTTTALSQPSNMVNDVGAPSGSLAAATGFQISQPQYDLESEKAAVLLGCRVPVIGNSIENATCDGWQLSSVKAHIAPMPQGDLSDSDLEKFIGEGGDAEIRFIPAGSPELSSGGLRITQSVDFDGSDVNYLAAFKAGNSGTNAYFYASATLALLEVSYSGESSSQEDFPLRLFDERDEPIADVVDFGEASYGKPRLVVLKNPTDRTVRMIAFRKRILGPAFRFLGQAYPGIGGDCGETQELAAKGECRVVLEFAPKVTGDFQARFFVLVEDQGKQVRRAIRLTGRGVAGKRPDQRVFITSTLYDGNLGGRAGADAKCQRSANERKLPGQWVALLNSRVSSLPYERHFAFHREITNMAGQSIMGDEALTPNATSGKINLDEGGREVSPALAWTGGPDFHLAFNGWDACSDNTFGRSSNTYESNSAGHTSYIGDGAALNYDRFRKSISDCARTHRLYCISAITSIPEAPITINARVNLRPGDVALKVALPLDVGALDKITIFRRDGATAPAKCYVDYRDTTSRAVYARLLTSADAATILEISDSTGRPDAEFSYTACLTGRNPFGHWRLEATSVLTSVKAAPGQVQYSHSIMATTRLTSGALNGIAGADALCAADAQAAGLPGTWKAVLSTLGSSARERLSINGPIRNLSNQFVAGTSEQFWGGFHTGQISLSDATYPGQVDIRTVLTGTLSGGAPAAENCENWSNSNLNRWGVISLMTPLSAYKFSAYSMHYFPQWVDQKKGQCGGYMYDGVYMGYRLYCLTQ